MARTRTRTRRHATPVSAPWRIHFFKRPVADADSEVPTIAFLDGLQVSVAVEIQAVLDTVASAPPPAFAGGGKWQAMHGDMAGIYEIRVQGRGQNHRPFCLLERTALDLGGPSIVCIGGLSKPRRQAAEAKEYRRILRLVAEFRQHRTVLE